MKLDLLHEHCGHCHTSAVAVPIKGDQVLLGKAITEDDRDGKWCFPGGGIKDGERPTTAAARECREETGVKTKPVSDVFHAHNMPHVAFVVCEYESGEPKPNHEFDDMKWIDIIDAVQYPNIFEPNRDIIVQLSAGICPSRGI